jgi:DNA-binding GntR family transcriptional regulator
MPNRNRKVKVSGAAAVDYSVRTLRRQIVDGFHHPSERISDLAVSEELTISRTSVRESFQKLVTEGLLFIVPNRGAFVVERTPEEVAELYEVREALEVQAVRLAIEKTSNEKLLSLKETLWVTKTSMIEHGGRYPVEVDFHKSICNLAENKELAQNMELVNCKLKIARRQSGYIPERARAAYGEHVEILEAMIRRDIPSAEKLIRQHLLNSRASFQNSINAKRSAQTNSIKGSNTQPLPV